MFACFVFAHANPLKKIEKMLNLKGINSISLGLIRNGSEMFDLFRGTDYDDFLVGAGGNDELKGFAGSDFLSGGSGNDLLIGGDGEDLLLGGSGDDRLFSDFGDDFVDAGAGDDLIMAGPGSDVIIGGEGDDEIYGYARSIGDEIPDDDAAIYAGNMSDYTIEVFEKYNGARDEMVMAVRITDNNLADGVDEGTDVLMDVEHLVFADTTVTVESLISGSAEQDAGLIGDDANNTLKGTDGFDIILGNGGNDLLKGFGGNDLVFGGEGNDTLLGGDGQDYLEGGAGDDLVIGDLGNDIVKGNAGSDDIMGGGGADTLFGGEGDDFIFGFGRSAAGDDFGDTAVYAGNMSDYTFEFVEVYNGARDEFVQELRITDSADGGADGVDEGFDRLQDIDILVFMDQTVLVEDLML